MQVKYASKFNWLTVLIILHLYISLDFVREIYYMNKVKAY